MSDVAILVIKNVLEAGSTPYCVHPAQAQGNRSQQEMNRLCVSVDVNGGTEALISTVRNWESGRSISMVCLGIGLVELNSIGGGDEAESKVATEGNTE